jgi:hypothetical protein
MRDRAAVACRLGGWGTHLSREQHGLCARVEGHGAQRVRERERESTHLRREQHRLCARVEVHGAQRVAAAQHERGRAGGAALVVAPHEELVARRDGQRLAVRVERQRRDHVPCRANPTPPADHISLGGREARRSCSGQCRLQVLAEANVRCVGLQEGVGSTPSRNAEFRGSFGDVTFPRTKRASPSSAPMLFNNTIANIRKFPPCHSAGRSTWGWGLASWELELLC